MSHLEILTENRLSCKRNAVRGDFGHRLGMPRTDKPTKKRPIKSPLQEVFLKRVQQEMAAQGLLHQDGRPNVTKLAGRVGAPPQTTLNDIVSLQADPRLEQVYKIAAALQVPAISLLTEIKVGNIHTLPSVPTIAGQLDKTSAHKARDRNRGRG